MTPSETRRDPTTIQITLKVFGGLCELRPSPVETHTVPARSRIEDLWRALEIDEPEFVRRLREGVASGYLHVLLNGRNVLDESSTHTFGLDEKLFRKLDPEQQWALLCELRKLGSRLAHAYDDGRIERGEVTEGDVSRLRSGMDGIEGSGLRTLRGLGG